MSTTALLEDLRRQDIRLEADGLTLRVNVPEESDTDELRATLREHKRALIRLLERERRRLEEAASRGLVIKWSREPGYLSVHDPTTGDWHELLASGCPPWMLEDAKTHRRGEKGGRTVSVCEDPARSLYLELRALGLELWVEDDPKGGPLDYGIEVDGTVQALRCPCGGGSWHSASGATRRTSCGCSWITATSTS